MPDAWDDDWIAKADSSTATAAEPITSSTIVSKAERSAKWAEVNRQIWEEAETPGDNFFLRSRDIVPLKSEFKPAIKVLSRKPEKKATTSADIGQLNIEDDDDDYEVDAKKSEMSPLERQEKAQREREEKQKKYEEVRQKLFGDDSPSTSIAFTNKRNNESRNQSGNKSRRDTSNKIRQLYDPNDNAKPAVLKKETQQNTRDVQPIRSPRAPGKSYVPPYQFATHLDVVSEYFTT